MKDGWILVVSINDGSQKLINLRNICSVETINITSGSGKQGMAIRIFPTNGHIIDIPYSKTAWDILYQTIEPTRVA